MRARRAAPRAWVVAACATIASLSVAIALAEDLTFYRYTDNAYRSDDSGRIKHRHSDNYLVLNPGFEWMNDNGALQNRVRDSREDWDTLSKTVGLSAAGNAAPDIKFDSVSAQTGAVTLDAADFHPAGQTTIFLDRSRFKAIDPSDQKGYICEAFGRVLGLADAPLTRADCMSDPTTYPQPANRSGDRLDAFYGPTISLASSLITHADGARLAGSYALGVTVTGHALKDLSATLNGKTLIPLTQASSTGYAGCVDSCSFTATKSQIAPSAYVAGPGRYELKVTATNTFGRTAIESRWIWLDYPYFGFNDDWEIPAWSASPASNYSLAQADGANAVRLGVGWREIVSSCTAGKPGTENWTNFKTAYDVAIAHGARPIVQVHGTPDCLKQSCPSPVAGYHPDFNVSAAAADDQWQAFVKNVALRAPQALGIEVWNEQNTTDFWGGCQPNPARYAELLRAAHAGAAEAAAMPINPNYPTIPVRSIPIYVGGLAPGNQTTATRTKWTDYLGALNKVATANNSEGLAVHPYPQVCSADGTDQAITNDVSKQLEAAETFQSAAGAATATPPDPVIVTEVGVSTRGNPYSPANPDTGNCKASEPIQSRRLKAIYALFQDHRIPIVIVHQFIDGATASNNWVDGLGVRNRTNANGTTSTRKDAYCDLAALRDYTGSGCP